MKRKNRRILLLILIVIISGLSYYYNFYLFENKYNQLSNELNLASINNQNIVNPIDYLKELIIRIDSTKQLIQTSEKILPFYPNNSLVYENLLTIINQIGDKIEININKISSNSFEKYSTDSYEIKGEGNFRDIFSLIYLFESTPEIFKVKLKSLKQTYNSDGAGRLNEKVLFELIIDVYYTKIDDFNINSIKNEQCYFVPMISDYFRSIIKLDIPPNDEGLLEVDGAKLLALMPDGVYIIDRKGNPFYLAEGDNVYLGYLTKIDYENFRCEFLLNKGGILEKVVIPLSDKENKQ